MIIPGLVLLMLNGDEIRGAAVGLEPEVEAEVKVTSVTPGRIFVH